MSPTQKNNKRILIIGYNFYPEPTGIGKYTGEKAYWLAKKGYDCSVITTYPYYPQWKVQEPYTKDRFKFKTETKQFKSGGKITIHRCPVYVPATPSGVKRMLLDLSFLITAFFKLLQLTFGRKFDSVLTVAPSFQFGLLGILYKKLRGAKLYYHVQDLQIEAARDLNMIRSEQAISFLFKVEKYILQQADVVSSISDAMIERIEEKAKKKVISFPNWADVNVFFPLPDLGHVKESFGFKASDTIVLYSGAIGEKQGLESILHAAKELHNIADLKFVICGSGPYKHKLEALAAGLGLTNLSFLPLQPYKKLNAFLNMADVHLVIQKANVSDLVMPSKLTTILAVGGVPIVTANKSSSLYNLVEKHQMGILVDAENQRALTTGIMNAVLEDNEYIRRNARAYAETNLSIDKIMLRFEDSITEKALQKVS